MDFLDFILGALFVAALIFVIYKVSPWFRRKANKAYGKDDNKPFR